MSKFVKNLLSEDLSKRLDGIDEALLVDVIGLDANSTMTLRRELRGKDIQLLVVKNSLARRATQGTALEPAFQEIDGTMAIVWGAEDIVSLAKEIVRLAGEKQYEGFAPRGGVLGGDVIDADKVKEVSKWPSREEQLSLLVGQILGPGATLSAQILGPGSTLAGQVKQKAEEDGEAN